MSLHSRVFKPALVASCLILPYLFGPGLSSGAEVIRVRGSESASAMVDSYAKEFMRNHPDCNIVVSGGQESGWPNFLKKESEICMSSLKIQDQELQAAKEQGMEVEEAIVGWGGIAIIVHPSNPMSEITVDQVRNVFNGQYTNWNKLGAFANEPLSVYMVGEKRSETVEYMTREFLKAPFGRYVMPKTYFRLIATAISEEPYSIGFVRFRNILRLKDQGLENKVKILAVKKDDQSPAVLPSRSNLDNGTYPLSRPYYLYIDRKKAGKPAGQFFDFCASKSSRRQ